MDNLTKLEKSLMSGHLRNVFEEYFPKDLEAERGERPSKSNRASALVFLGEIIVEIRKLNDKNRLQKRDRRCSYCRANSTNVIKC